MADAFPAPSCQTVMIFGVSPKHTSDSEKDEASAIA